jgi:hypothetical protein
LYPSAQARQGQISDTINVWDIGANATPGGSPEDPALLFTIFRPGVGVAGTNGRWHSTVSHGMAKSSSWDGSRVGGAEPECEATHPDIDKSMFFYDGTSGTKLGTWVLPRPQSVAENCTIHNYNMVPLRSGRYVAVSGNYQAGTWATDFTDPSTRSRSAGPTRRRRHPVANRSTNSGAPGRRTGTTTSSTNRRSPRESTFSGSVAPRRAARSACHT